MPRTLSFPPPSTATCPICSARLSAPRCGSCGATFTGEDGATLWRVDHDLFDLCRIRNDVVHRLLTTAAVAEPAPAADRAPAPAPVAAKAPAPAPDPTPVVDTPAPPRSGPPPAPPTPSTPRAPRPRPAFTAAEVLVGLGALSLVAAVAVFAAVSWSDLAAWAQGSLIVGLTGVVLAAAVACRRRHLVATSESLGAVGVALGLADVQVARVGLDGVVPDRWVWAAGVALVAAGTIALGRRSGIRVLALGGTAMAFAPLVVAASGGRPLAGVSALAVQAVVGGAVAAHRREHPLERTVLLVGASLSWGGAVAASLALALAGLTADPVAQPVGPALVLVALAAASIVGARRLSAPADDPMGLPSLGAADLVGGAGVALAFAPAVLLSLGSESVIAVLVVAAVQGVGALALAGTGRATPGERAVLLLAGAASWAVSAVGAMGLAVVHLVDDDPATSPLAASVVLGALALGSIAVGRVRRSDEDLVAGLSPAGALLAFVPGLLVAASGSTLTFLVVAAAQAIAALALAGSPLLRPSERAVAVVGGWTLGVAATVGALVLVLVEVAARLDELDPRLGAVGVLGGLALGAVVVGRVTHRDPLTAAGASLAFLPVPLVVLGVVSPTVLVGVLLGEALAAALLATVVRPVVVRSSLLAGGVATWTAAVTGAGVVGLAGWLAEPVQGPAGASALLVALAALAVGAALRSGWDAAATGLGLGAAVVPVLLAVALAAGGLGPDGWVATVVVASGLLALGAGLLGRVDGDRPWTAPWGVALVAGAALAVVPARTALTVVAALADRATTTPDVGAGVVLADWLRPALSGGGMAAPGWAAMAQLIGAAALAGAVGVLHPRLGRVVGAVVAVAGLVVVPVAAGLTVAVTVAGLGLVVVAAAVVVRLRPRDPELLLGTMATIAVGTLVAVASAPWTVGWTVFVGLVVGGLAVEAVVRRSPDAPVWVGAAVGVVLVGVALDAWVLGASGVDGLLAVAVAAAVVSPLAAVLERRGDVSAADVVDALVGIALVSVLVLAPAVTGSVLELSPFLAVVGVTAAGAALRPRRRSAWLVATASAVLLAWVQAGRAEVDLVEAYTLPLAAWALVVGAVVGRRLGSWERFGIGLVAVAGPTTALALVDPDPLRTVGVVAVGVAVAVWGAWGRLQAPLAIGAGSVAVLAVRHLGPVSVELPRYVTFAVAGLVLLAVGATFEQRRQDLRQAREAFVRLR